MNDPPAGAGLTWQAVGDPRLLRPSDSPEDPLLEDRPFFPGLVLQGGGRTALQSGISPQDVSYIDKDLK